jgi:GAF domain-containing protein
VPFVIERCREVLDAEGASVLLLDPDRRDLYFPYVAAKAAVAARLATVRFPVTQGIAGEVVRTGRTTRVDDVRTHPSFYAGVDRATGAVTRSVLAAPLVADGAVIGVLQVVNRRGDAVFDDEDLRFLDALAGAVGVALANAQRYVGVRTAGDALRGEVTRLRRTLARDAAGATPLRTALAAFERRHIERALRRHAGDVARAAATLGVSRATLAKRMRALGVRGARRPTRRG